MRACGWLQKPVEQDSTGAILYVVSEAYGFDPAQMKVQPLPPG